MHFQCNHRKNGCFYIFDNKIITSLPKYGITEWRLGPGSFLAYQTAATIKASVLNVFLFQ